MFALHDRAARLCDGISRRELLRVGGLSALGLSLPALLRAEARAGDGAANGATFGRAKNVIFLWLQGGPPQHETFDPKPEAPAEIRGVFKPIQTNVPGIQFCELLPRTARVADKLAVVRSLSTDNDIHSASGYAVLTGYKYVGVNPRTIQPTDWPYFGSIVKMLKPSEKLPALSTVWIPDLMRLNEGVTPAGQTGGFLGPQWDPDRFIGDPSDPNYRIEGLASELPPLRLKRRERLLGQIEQHFAGLRNSGPAGTYNVFQQAAFDLLTSGRASEAFRIDKEPDELRRRYGVGKWGQCVLLARRLVEAGVRLVHVNWPRDPGDNAVDNPLWDTHAQNADRLEDVLCPQFDMSFAALLDDLDQRGLLGETLVVAIAEFGRTPKINPQAGRDHWGHVFSFALAGAGISGGQVYGSSDKNGAYPASDRVETGDLTATLFHLLGIDHTGAFTDRQGRLHRLTQGEPIYKLLGTAPATLARTEPEGDVARLTFDPSLLLNTNFDDAVPLRPADFGSRPKGWRADPLLADESGALGVKLLGNTGDRHAAIGFGLASAADAVKIPHGARAMLAQEIRNPRLGTFVLTVRARGEGSSREFYETQFLGNFTCRLVFYRYADGTKNPTKYQVIHAQDFMPRFTERLPGSEPRDASADEPSFEMTTKLDAPAPGQNFAIGRGLGIALIVEKTSSGDLELPPGAGTALVCIGHVSLDFADRKRNDNVTV